MFNNKMDIDSPIRYLPGVGPKKADLLEKYLQIKTVEDLLYYFPFKHIDKSKFYELNSIPTEDIHVLVKGRIIDYQEIVTERGKRLIAKFVDKYAIAEIIWFNNYEWIQKFFPIGCEVVICGKPSFFFNSVSFVHPEIEHHDKFMKNYIPCLEPNYSIPEKLKEYSINSKFIRKLLLYVFENIGEIIDPLPQDIINRHNLYPLKDALKYIHFPDNYEILKKAKERLKFDELFFSQLPLVKLKIERNNTIKGYVFYKENDYYTKIVYKNLHFTLTKAQIKVLQEIRNDVVSGKQMNRLLQGDVGSGKTIVALFAMLMGVDNGYQACLMAPTEILAKQHFVNITEICKNTEIKISLLTGSTKPKERTEILENLANGTINILIGTHALIEERVQFKNLGIIVIDEQQRFGVAQRAQLWKKSEYEPHILIMTATPIPRTLALTQYGDLDVSVIDELPPHRVQVKTIHFSENQRLLMFNLVKQKIKQGDQVFVVFPLIYESEKLNLQNIQEGEKLYKKFFPEPEYSIITVHGQMSTAEKDSAMQRFLNKEAQILISTTVIEVGVDVPNATIMIIENAERYGLAQLHQLRGRVGRGKKESYCFLITPVNLSKEAMKRIEIITSTTNGFEIAQKDLEMRGPGEIDGTLQSGYTFNFKLAELSSNENLLSKAREEAYNLLLVDKDLINYPYLLQKLKQWKNEIIDWCKIG
ncbi:MAG: ATP-dependent DNA helicase RecG [Bacteroidales bacterium]|nr:ATP-dependent DNA helicase RecG [Bacteroidales bacterium]